jgi:hypothetical protein
LREEMTMKHVGVLTQLAADLREMVRKHLQVPKKEGKTPNLDQLEWALLNLAEVMEKEGRRPNP